MPSWLTLKLGGMIAGAAAILSFVLLSLHWKSEMTSRGKQLDTICAATRAASGITRLKCDQVPQQIAFLGEAVTSLSGALAKQNAAVQAMGAETMRQQQESAKASQIAQERAGRAQATSTRLEASSRAGEAQAKPCEPSEALAGAWR